jgi:hypothetical protein
MLAPGCIPAAMQFLAERRVALLGSDGNNDTAPSVVATIAAEDLHSLGLDHRSQQTPSNKASRGPMWT